MSAQTPSPSSSTARAGPLGPLLIGVIALVVVAVVIAVYGCYTAFLIYSPYDDEGCLMLARRLFLEGHPLYTDVYVNYGPFYFAYYLLLNGPLGVPITHTATRVVTIVHWLLASAACGALVYTHARSRFCAGLAFILAAGLLIGTVFSAGHPQELVALLTPLAILAAAGIDGRRTGPLAAAALGCVAAALVMIKINVGVFFVLALAFTYLSSGPPTRLNRFAFAAATAAAIVLPAVLMRRDAFPPSWAFPPAAAVALGMLALAFAAFPRVGQPRRGGAASRSKPAITLAAGAVTAAVVCAVIFARGTTPYGLLEGVVLGPLVFARSYAHLSAFPIVGVAIGAVSCLAAVVLAAWPLLAEARAVQLVLALAKCCAALAALYFAATLKPEYLIAVLPPLLWLLIAPPVDPLTRFSRTLLAAVGALYVLQVYPWAGAQRHLGAFLVVPAAVVLLYDAANFSNQRIAGGRRATGSAAIRYAAIGAAILIGLAGVKYIPRIADGYLAYRHAGPLGLPGTAGIRPAHSSLERILSTADVTPVLHWMTNNLRAHADSFVSVPAINSLYFWTGLPPSVLLAADPGMTTLDDAQEQRVIDALASSDRPCVIYNEELLKFWQSGGDTANGPLVRYIQANFRTIQRVGTYEFMVRNDRALDELYISLLAGERAFARSLDALRLPTGLFHGSSEFSVSGWFRADAPGVVLGLERNSKTGFPAIYVDLDGRLRCQLSTSTGGAVVSGQAVADGAWHHVAIVTTSSLQRVFLEGAEIGQLADPAPTTEYPFARLGRGMAEGWPRTSAEASVFRGDLSDFRLYPRILADSEIQQLAIPVF